VGADSIGVPQSLQLCSFYTQSPKMTKGQIQRERHKEYRKIADRDRRIDQVKRVREYKNGIKTWGCFLCGYKKCQEAIEFHHVEKKIYEIAKLENRLSTFKKEVQRCIPICANCHREVHNDILPSNVVEFKYKKFLDKLGVTQLEELPLFNNGV
jgi:hypothetical protein